MPKITQPGPLESPLGCTLEDGLEDNRRGKGGRQLEVMQGALMQKTRAENVSRMPSGGQRQEKKVQRQRGGWLEFMNNHSSRPVLHETQCKELPHADNRFLSGET